MIFNDVSDNWLQAQQNNSELWLRNDYIDSLLTEALSGNNFTGIGDLSMANITQGNNLITQTVPPVAAYIQVDSNGVPLTKRNTLNFLPSLTAVDNASGTTDISATAGTTVQLVKIDKNGALVGTRPEVNLIEGTNVTMGVVDNAGANRVDVTVNASSTTALGVDKNGVLVGTRPTINLIEGSNVNLTVVDNGGSNRVDITFNVPVSGGLFSQTNSVTVSNTTTETALTGTGSGSLTLPANFFSVGTLLHLHAKGVWDHAAFFGQTLQFKLKFGATVIADTGVISAMDTIAGSKTFDIDSFVTCRTTGVGGTVLGQLNFLGGGYIAAGAEGQEPGIDYSGSNSSAVTVNTTTTQTVSLTVTWGSAVVSDTITVTNLILKQEY